MRNTNFLLCIGVVMSMFAVYCVICAVNCYEISKKSSFIISNIDKRNTELDSISSLLYFEKSNLELAEFAELVKLEYSKSTKLANLEWAEYTEFLEKSKKWNLFMMDF